MNICIKLEKVKKSSWWRIPGRVYTFYQGLCICELVLNESPLEPSYAKDWPACMSELSLSIADIVQMVGYVSHEEGMNVAVLVLDGLSRGLAR